MAGSHVDASSTRAARRRSRWVIACAIGGAALLGLALLVAARDLFRTPRGTAAPLPLNFVVFMLDDERWDLTRFMPRRTRVLGEQGVTFENAFVTQPFCCPYRASFLAGGLDPRNTGVVAGEGPNGGAIRFHDADTLATTLQGAGYETAMVGKYVNGYEEIAPRVPPGWSYFFADAGGREAVEGSSTPYQAGVGTELTGLPDVMERTRLHFDKAVEFIEANIGSPFFAYIAVHTPHYPPMVYPEDQDLYPNFTYRYRGYGEADLSDKPAAVRGTAEWYIEEYFHSIEEQDEFQRDQVRSLQEIDRQVERIVTLLEARGVAGRTVFLYTSDNGYLWGEHQQFRKSKPYEESIRVPLLIRMPGAVIGARSGMVVGNLDVPATILDLAGVDRYSDGQSLVPMLLSPTAPGRDQVFISQPGAGWLGVREQRWKYIERRSGEFELYDLENDPFEMESRHADPSLAPVRSRLAAAAAARAPVSTRRSPFEQMRVGVPFSFDQVPWGGAPPYRWGVIEGELPAGVVVNAATGKITGTPVRAGTHPVLLEVRDSSDRPITGGPQRWRTQWAPVVAFDGDDHDGVATAQDRCPEAYDPLQRDADGDGRGDACDDVCDNGVDDDGDGDADFGEDAGCAAPTDTSERGPGSECDDALDNDEDGYVDREDPQCFQPGSTSEAGGCGLGAELAGLLLVVGALRRSRRGRALER